MGSGWFRYGLQINNGNQNYKQVAELIKESSQPFSTEGAISAENVVVKNGVHAQWIIFANSPKILNFQRSGTYISMAAPRGKATGQETIQAIAESLQPLSDVPTKPPAPYAGKSPSGSASLYVPLYAVWIEI